MRIAIEVSHPAHVHYFRTAAALLEGKGHTIRFIAKQKEVTLELARAYGLDFVSFGTGRKSLLGKAFNLLADELRSLRFAFSFRPDAYVSFSSPYLGHVARLTGKPHFVFDDTEHASLEHAMYKPFASLIVTPRFFMKDMGPKHFKFDGFFELCYLHPSYFKPDPEIRSELGLSDGERFAIVRFISWDALHDRNQTGFTVEMKIRAVKELCAHGRVFISAEGDLPPELEVYRMPLEPERMHQAMAEADLFFGESGTMAIEAAILGTPSVRVSTLAKHLGNFREARDRYDIVHFYDDGPSGLNKALEVFADCGSKAAWLQKRDRLIEDKVDVTAMIAWVVGSWPDSKGELAADPDRLDRFRSRPIAQNTK